MYLTPLVTRLGTPKFRRFIMDLLPWKTLHQLRDITDVMHDTSVEIVKSKKRALEDGGEAVAGQIGEGKDILSILSTGLPFLNYAWTSLLAISASKYGCFGGGSFDWRRDNRPDLVSVAKVAVPINCHWPICIPRTFTFAATDTTSGALGRILFLLSIHQDVQDKLRQEIREARKSGDLSYDELVALPYLDAVCRETLRVFVCPPLYYCLC